MPRLLTGRAISRQLNSPRRHTNLNVAFEQTILGSKLKKNKLTFAVRKEEKWLTAQCIEFPSVATQGRNHKELMAMISDAVDGYFSAFPEEKERLESLEKAKVIEITI